MFRHFLALHEIAFALITLKKKKKTGQGGGMAEADGRTTAGRGARGCKDSLITSEFSGRAAGEGGNNKTTPGQGGGRAEADGRTTAGRGARQCKGPLVSFEFSGRAAGEGGRTKQNAEDVISPPMAIYPMALP